MSRIEELIKEKCPDGVEYFPLLTVANVLYGYPCDASLFNTKSDGKPLARIRDVLSGVSDTYTTENVPERYELAKGDLLVGMDGNFHVANWKTDGGILCQRVCKVYSVDVENTITNGYLSHILGPIVKKIEEGKPSGTVKHLLDKDIKAIEIPVPPIEVQQEIVRVLDNFMELEAELQAELEARKKQYDEYLNLLMDFSYDKTIKYMSVGELFDIKNGLNKEKDAFGKGKPIINFTDVFKKRYLVNGSFTGLVDVNEGEIERYSAKKGDVFFTRTSETREDVGMSSTLIEDVEGCVFSGFVLRARPMTKLLLPKFCAYYFATYNVRKTIIRYASFTTRATTTGPKLSKIMVPILPIEEQQRIVDILDKMDSICNDLENGLPAEIKARHKQYEYYRDKLLTFERKVV